MGNEEGPLPFPYGTFNHVISSAALHWVNDLLGLLLEIKRVLKPDGYILLAMVHPSLPTYLPSSLPPFFPNKQSLYRAQNPCLPPSLPNTYSLHRTKKNLLPSCKHSAPYLYLIFTFHLSYLNFL